jgi:hypothetical protein
MRRPIDVRNKGVIDLCFLETAQKINAGRGEIKRKNSNETRVSTRLANTIENIATTKACFFPCRKKAYRSGIAEKKAKILLWNKRMGSAPRRSIFPVSVTNSEKGFLKY